MINMGSEKFMEKFMALGKNHNGFLTPRKVPEPLVALTRLQQQQARILAQAWIEHLWKVRNASRSGDIKKVWETCMESNKNFLGVCQEALREQAAVRYELLMKVIPAVSATSAKE